MVGKVTSEGDRAMRSNTARNLFNLDGSGIKIGVISVSYNAQNGAAQDVLNGELPGYRNPNGYRKPVKVLQDTLSLRNDEGRAMLQIVHDVAPGAQLFFHSTGSSEEEFAQAVRSLVRAGADIIVDDIGFSTTLIFQDGVAAQAVNEAAARGVVYFSSAGNDGNRSYQSPFRAGTTFTYRGNTYEAHDFDPSSGVDLFQDIQFPEASSTDILYETVPGLDLVLSWDQALGKVSNDLELFLVDRPQLPGAGGTLLSNVTLVSPRPDAPLREIQYFTPSAQTAYLVIARRINPTSPAPNLLKWVSFANGGDDGIQYQYVNTPAATGSSTITGQANARGAIAVGAASYTTTPPFGGKIPILESFSSQGGTPILFDAEGNRLSTPDVRQKPDIVGPDRVSTALSSSNLYLDFSSFPGTSAAAPHAAAVAALMLQRAGGRKRLTPAQVLTVLQKTALAMGASGNFDSGAGFIQANRAVLQSFLTETRGNRRNNRIAGRSSSDNIYGLAGNDSLSGADGLDAIFGGLGRDSLNGGSHNDYLVGDRGNDVLLGGQGHDRLEGSQGHDRLSGNAGNDVLQGGDGNDRLIGGQGNNRLLGGSGKDVFDLDRKGFATIQDFRNGEDRLTLLPSIPFSDLDIVQQGRNTVIQLYGDRLAILQQFKANTLNAKDFTVV